MKILIDMHNHTISSGHAYSTVQEIALEASKKGLKYIGITDHGPSMDGAANIFHVWNMRVIPETIHGVGVLKGVEANIVNENGDLDVPDDLLASLDIVLAGLHEECILPSNREDNTRAVLNVMDNKYVDVLVHLGNPVYPIDMERVVLKAKERNILLEINNSTFTGTRQGSEENCYRLADLCKKYKVPVIVNSDSHIAFDVGRLDLALKLLKDIDMPEDLIINSSLERFENHMKARGKTRFNR